MSNSTWEFAASVGDLQDKASRIPRILGYAAHNSMSDYYTRGVHGIYYIAAVLRKERKKGRGRCLQASYLTSDWRRPPGVLSFVHEDREDQRFYGQLHLQSGMDGQVYMRFFGNCSGDFEGRIPASPGKFRYNTWNAMQLVIQEMILKRTTPQDDDDLLEKAYMFLMGFKSVLENKGAPVSRKEVKGWEIPPSLLREDFRPTAPSSNPILLENSKVWSDIFPEQSCLRKSRSQSGVNRFDQATNCWLLDQSSFSGASIGFQRPQSDRFYET